MKWNVITFWNISDLQTDPIRIFSVLFYCIFLESYCCDELWATSQPKKNVWTISQFNLHEAASSCLSSWSEFSSRELHETISKHFIYLWAKLHTLCILELFIFPISVQLLAKFSTELHKKLLLNDVLPLDGQFENILLFKIRFFRWQ